MNEHIGVFYSDSEKNIFRTNRKGTQDQLPFVNSKKKHPGSSALGASFSMLLCGNPIALPVNSQWLSLWWKLQLPNLDSGLLSTTSTLEETSFGLSKNLFCFRGFTNSSNPIEAPNLVPFSRCLRLSHQHGAFRIEIMSTRSAKMFDSWRRQL